MKEEHIPRVNQRYFPLNHKYYTEKWGGQPRSELHIVPFAGVPKGDMTARRNYWMWTPQEFAGRHVGQRCIIACNGPSLNEVDTKLLTNEIIFGLNRGYLKEGLPITYLVAVNGQVMQDYGEEIVDVPAVATFIPPMPHLLRPHTYGLYFKGDVEFTGNLDAPIYQGHTVTFVAMQIAFYMGFKEVILVGADHDFPRQPGYVTNASIVAEGKDTDHFHPDYFPEGSTWETPNLERSEEAYRLAKYAFEGVGGRIINATAGGELEVFDRMDLNEALGR